MQHFVTSSSAHLTLTLVLYYLAAGCIPISHTPGSYGRFLSQRSLLLLSSERLGTGSVSPTGAESWTSMSPSPYLGPRACPRTFLSWSQASEPRSSPCCSHTSDYGSSCFIMGELTVWAIQCLGYRCASGPSLISLLQQLCEGDKGVNCQPQREPSFTKKRVGRQAKVTWDLCLWILS